MSEVSGRGFVCEEKPEHRRPRGHLSGGGAVRPDRRAVGGAGAVAACAVAVGPSVVVEQAAVDRREREIEMMAGARPASSGSSSDDSGQGVRIEVEPGFGLRRVPVSSKSSGTVRRKGRR